MSGILDKFPPMVQHVILLVMAFVIANGANGVDQLHLSTPVNSLIGAVLTLLITFFTTITKKYGVGVPAPIIPPAN